MSSEPTSPLRVPVALGDRSYDILIGSGVLAGAATAWRGSLGTARAAVVTDEQVAPLHLDTLMGALRAAGIGCESVILPAGEESKSFARLEALLEQLLALRVERRDAVVALGGGVIGDLAGLAAALLRRGVGFVQAPTTLLAQVDSAVGGKTAINSVHGKNLIGAFWQPRLVLADVGVLATLPPRERRAGYAEVVKYGLLGDRSFFEWLERHGRAVLDGDATALTHAVAESCRHKARIVAADEREQGQRALLNLGHTFGHALEAEFGYDGRLLHGEAVAIGCVAAFELSARLGLCPPAAPARVRRHFRAAGLPAAPADLGLPSPPTDRLIAHMAQDKKVSGGRLVFVLVREIGEAFVSTDVGLPELDAALSQCLAA